MIDFFTQAPDNMGRWRFELGREVVVITDIYTRYEVGLRALLQRLGADHPRYDDALVYQQRLSDNLAAARRYGDTEARRADRAEILDQLNTLTRATLEVSFNALCSADAGQGPAPIESALHVETGGGAYVAGDVVIEQGDFIGRDQTTEACSGTEQDAKVAAGRTNLPPKPYHRLVGRREELEQLLDVLRQPKRKPMTAIVGLGGIGKTALAYGVVSRLLDGDVFDGVVWTSAKQERFEGEAVKHDAAAPYTFDTLLNDIGRQCGRSDILEMPPERKRAVVVDLLQANRVLIVMDNLETVSESSTVIGQLVPMLGASKLLITSRHHVKHAQVFTLNLSGFPVEEGVVFLREESRERGIKEVAQADHSQLLRIQTAAGGAPLAMRLVVGQVSRSPLEVVLSNLKQANYHGETYPFYRFLFFNSWHVLDMPARRVLVDMAVFPPRTGGAVADVVAISQVPEAEFWPAISQLVTLSLVDKIGALGEERFALHTLTQNFVKSDITREWAGDKD